MMRISTAALAAMVALSACSDGDDGGSTPPATYGISGVVSGAVSEGVTVSLAGAATATATTDASGSYAFAGLPSGSYTVTPSLSGFAFSPASLAVTVNGADVTAQDFTASAAPSTHGISGTVSGAVAAGVTISLTGANTGSTVTDASGSYAFTGLVNGAYTVTPGLTGFAFTPESLAVTVTGADVTGRDFTASAAPGTFGISGTVSGAVVEGVTVILSGASGRTTTTDASGSYAFIGLSSGSYTVTPSLTGFAFTPASLAVTVADADVTGQDFTSSVIGNTYSISGTVSGDVMEGVTVTLGGDGSDTVLTDASGSYTFSGLPDGGYTLTPRRIGFTFAPQSLSVTVSGADVAGQDFTATSTGQSLGITTNSLPQGVVGRAYDATVAAVGGVQPYVFSGVGLPAWLTLASDGSLSGTPTEAGTFPFTVTVADGAGDTATKELSVNVR